MSLPQDLSLTFPNSHQEYSLYTYVPESRYSQLLKILTGITGMSPDIYTNHHLVYKPKRPKPTPGAPPTTELYYIQLISRVELEASEYDPHKQRWSMRLDDLPEVVRRPCVSRAVLSANTGAGDVIEFMDALGYTLQTPYFTDNVRFVHGNVIITLSQVHTPLEEEREEGGEERGFGVRQKCRAMDPMGGWTMQAAVRVLQNTDVESVEKGVGELTKLKEVLRGVCDLEIVERLALDTRVR